MTLRWREHVQLDIRGPRETIVDLLEWMCREHVYPVQRTGGRTGPIFSRGEMTGESQHMASFDRPAAERIEAWLRARGAKKRGRKR